MTGRKQYKNLDNYSLDTHALVWYIREPKTLSEKSKSIVREIFEGSAGCFLSTMTILEAFYVSVKHKDFIFADFIKEIDCRDNIKIVPFDQKVLEQSIELPKNMDIHDRIIVATAIITNTPLVTKDKVLRGLFPKETIW